MTNLIIDLTKLSLIFIKETNKSFSNALPYYGREKVEEEATQIVKKLRDEAYGLVSNYNVEVENNNIIHNVKEIGGENIGTLMLKVSLEVPIDNPEESVVSDILLNLKDYDIRKISFVYKIYPAIANLNNLLPQILGENDYKILEININKGIRVRLNKSLKGWILCENNQLKITVETEFKVRLYSLIGDFQIKDFTKILPNEL